MYVFPSSLSVSVIHSLPFIPLSASSTMGSPTILGYDILKSSIQIVSPIFSLKLKCIGALATVSLLLTSNSKLYSVQVVPISTLPTLPSSPE